MSTVRLRMHTPQFLLLSGFFFYISLMLLLEWRQSQSWFGHAYSPKVPLLL